MNGTVIIGKNIGYTKDRKMYNFTAMFLGETKKNGKGLMSRKMIGNIPVFPQGTVLNINYDLSDDGKTGKVTSFSYDSNSPKNKTLLNKAFNNDSNIINNFIDNIRVLQETNSSWSSIEAFADRNPYLVLPFSDADKLFMAKGHKANDKERIDALKIETIEYARKMRKEEYTVEEYIKYADKIQDKGSFNKLSLGTLFTTFLDTDLFYYDNVLIKDKTLSDARSNISNIMSKRSKKAKNRKELIDKDKIEQFIANKKRLATNNGYEFGEEQENIVRCLANNNITIITGGAGVGKTSVISLLLECYGIYGDINEICLLAPTGKASRRIAEKTSFDATTIHSRLCKFDGFTKYNEYNTLPYKLFIIDESSMIDTLLMNDLLSATGFDSKIIFVGDHNQLPPVGCGEPFFDFIRNAENLCDIFYLTKNYRQGKNDILLNATNVLNNLPIVKGKGVDIYDIAFEDIEKIVNGISDDNTQIISPYNEIGRIINNFKKKGANAYNEGDKVVATKNTSDYSNGDIGTVERVNDSHSMYVKFPELNETFLIERKDMQNIDLAYSLTVHKMQGSENDNIVLFLPKESNDFIDSRLLYTAITRAKEHLTIFYYDTPKVLENN